MRIYWGRVATAVVLTGACAWGTVALLNAASDAASTGRLTSETPYVTPTGAPMALDRATYAVAVATPTPEPTASVGDARWIEYVENDGAPYAVAHGYGEDFDAARADIAARLGCDESDVADDDWGDDGIMGYCESTPVDDDAPRVGVTLYFPTWGTPDALTPAGIPCWEELDGRVACYVEDATTGK